MRDCGPGPGVAGWEHSGGAERQVGTGPGSRSLLGRMPDRRWRVLGRGRGLFAIEEDTALRQRELFGAAEYPVRRAQPDGRGRSGVP